MPGFKSYSTDPNANVEYFAEFQSASSVNDGARQMQADAAGHYFDHDWIEYGKGNGAGDGTTDDYSVTYISSTQFRIDTADVTAAYHVGRKVRAVGAGTGTIYGAITATTYTGTNTEVTVSWESGGLSNEALRIYIGPAAVNTSWPKKALEGQNIDLDAELQRAKARDTREVFVTANPVANVVTINLGLGDRFKSTLDQNVTTVTVTGWPATGIGRSFMWIVQQNGTGGYTLTFPAGWKWPGASAATVSSGANERDRFGLFSEDGGSTIDAIVIGQDFS